jgi:hypothetical protein
MVIETQLQTFFEWFWPWGLLGWLAIVALISLGILLFGSFVAVLRHGPVRGFQVVGRVLAEAGPDLVRISPRRVWALGLLAVKESIRRRVVVGFAVFLTILLFAGWFLDTKSTDPAKLYLSFVLTATSYLVLLLMLFLSALSLPLDIRSKTLHTVVTKPVRPSEIVLGRVLGFVLIGTGLLAVMGLISYVFVVRGLAHTHQLDPAVVEAARAEKKDRDAAVDVTTTEARGHQHAVHVARDGTPTLAMENGHWHSIERDEEGNYRIGPQEGSLQARVPIYGKLRFLNRQGQPAEKGINVGDEWTYRSYIEGRTSAAAIWTFAGITEKKFPEGLPVEMTLGVFRTWKGADIEKPDEEIPPGIQGSLSVRNPETGLIKELPWFRAKKLQIDRQFIPRSIKGADLFQDLVSDGRVEVILRCHDPAMFFGAAQPDLYLRARDASFELNFVKGYLGIWLQMLLVIGLGVGFSTFLSGPVAILATAGSLILGFFSDFMYRLATGQTYGGGPVESLVRLVTQQNVVSEMEPGPRTTMAKMMDVVINGPLWVMSKILPPFGDFSCADYVAYGFDVSPDVMLINAFRAMAFLLPVFVAGYLFLKTREIA